jgi:hypothetical protein
MDAPSEGSLFPNARKPLGWALLYLLFVAGIFNYPHYPAVELDASWRMAFGYFFQQKFQFGRDIVFNYGPLGFVMGKTYSGLQYTALLLSQLAVGLVGAGLILHEGRRMQGLSRWAFFLGLFFFGITYEDALQMLMIALIGFQLLRGESKPAGTAGLALALAVLGVVKFTNLMLAALIVVAVVALAFWRGRRREGWLIAAFFGGGFLLTWIACGQNPLNLPAYFRGSWEISQGYNDTMGISTPWSPLWKAFVVLGVIGGYLLLHLRLNPDKPRALANVTVMAGFIFLNWKHGFVRADGHMIGFFFCALLPLTAYPALLGDPPRFRRLHYVFFLAAGIMTLSGIESALFHTTRSCAAIIEDKIWTNLGRTFNPAETRHNYRDQLSQARDQVNLETCRPIVGRASLDVLGFEQAVALFNDFNYRPRPIFQSYSVFTPYLGRLNGSYYESDAAPEYVLLKIQAIDGRMPMMDDSEVWRLFPHRYDFVQAERGFQLWRRQPGPFDPATVAPTPLLATDLANGQNLPLDAYAGKQLWARIELKQSLIGKLHAFLYKPPRVLLVVKDAKGIESEFQLSLPMGRTGFILSPVIEDAVTFAAFANARAGREVRSLSLKIKPKDRFLFADTARIEISELKPSHSGDRFFNQQNEMDFPMFKSYPFQYDAHTPISRATIDGRPVVVLHAPSEMIFNLPANPQSVSGAFGLLPGTYSNGGNTNGAEFVVHWINGAESTELYRRYLDPVNVVADRGLHDFNVDLSKLKGGRLFLRIEPGPFGNFAWDWTCWTGIEIK